MSNPERIFVVGALIFLLAGNFTLSATLESFRIEVGELRVYKHLYAIEHPELRIKEDN